MVLSFNVSNFKRSMYSIDVRVLIFSLVNIFSNIKCILYLISAIIMIRMDFVGENYTHSISQRLFCHCVNINMFEV